MTPDEDDHDLLRVWRDEAHEAPGVLLDRRVLAAAQAQVARRRLLPLAAAMAACLALALYAQKPWQTVAPAPVTQLDTSTFGLYEGRGYSEGRQQIPLRQRPAGFGAGEVVSP